MAMDKIRIYITNVSLIGGNVFEEKYKYNWIFNRNKENQCLSYYSRYINGIFVKYMPMHKDDSLYIDFNPARLLQNDNIASIYSCNIQQLHNIIRDRLKGVVNINATPNIRYWKISYYENNINVIKDSDSIKALYKVISKLENIGKLKKEIYEDEGTIYFFNGIDKDHSDFVIKIYYKLRQILNTSPGAVISDYYESKRINLKPGEDILRIEVSLGRDVIYKLFKPTITKFSSDGKVTQINEIPSSKPVAILEEVFNFEKQVNIIDRALKMLHLDNIMATKSALFKFIDNRTDINKTQKKMIKNVLNHINNVSHKSKPSIATIYKCRRWVLSQGYHFIYADVEIKPIILEDIIKQLPNKQQDFIKLYGNSNIYYDFWSSSRPSRIY